MIAAFRYFRDARILRC